MCEGSVLLQAGVGVGVGGGRGAGRIHNWRSMTRLLAHYDCIAINGLTDQRTRNESVK